MFNKSGMAGSEEEATDSAEAPQALPADANPTPQAMNLSLAEGAY